MPRLTIDGRRVEVPPGSTLLEAARTLGIDVPTLCYLEGYEASTSCLVCMVRVRGRNGFVPSCATLAGEGMEVESETAEVHQVRKTALELLLSDHVGDCLAPCHFTCPAHMDIPLMLRQITAEDLREAIVTVKEAIALPAVLGRICPKPCEKGCRRGAADGAVAVCQLKRFVADADLAAANPYLPECKPSTGKRVAIVGAGPTGLSAAYYLRREGHAVTLFDEQPEPGGRLLRETTPGEKMGTGTSLDAVSPGISHVGSEPVPIFSQALPRDVLAAEIGLILRLGVELRANTRVGREATLEGLCREFDAVLLACGTIGKDQVERWGLKPAAHGILVDKETFQTNLPGVFAAGNAIRAKGMVVRSVADGREVAAVVSCQLSVDSGGGLGAGGIGQSSDNRKLRTDNRQLPTVSRIGKLEPGEVAGLVTLASPAARQEADAARGFDVAEAVRQAGRCLHCDCRALSSCKLRRYAALYGAEPGRFRDRRRALRQFVQPSGVIYEPGKCIDCGLCIQIVAAAKEPLGLTFVGRGFDVRVGVPFDRSLEEALGRVAAECIAACPTAALAWKGKDEG